MKCDFEIKIGDNKYIIKNTSDNSSYEAFRKSLLTAIENNDPQIMDLHNILESRDKIDLVDLTSINHNSVGLFSLAEFGKSFNIQDLRLLRQLPANKNSKNIVVGYSTSDIRTKFYDGTLFVNLNYDYDKVSKGIA
jgi:hypothetical protein